MAPKWAIALSVTTWGASSGGGSTLAEKNVEVIKQVTSKIKQLNNPDLCFALQNITKRDPATFECEIEYSIDGAAPTRTDKNVIVGKGKYLDDFVKWVDATTKSDNIILWMISHGVASIQTFQTPEGEHWEIPERFFEDVIVTSPTDHPKPKRFGNQPARTLIPPMRTGQILSGRTRASTSVLSWSDKVQVTSREFGDALKNNNPKLAVFLLQSCQAGGIDLIDALASNAAATHVVASATNLPVPSAEHETWIGNLATSLTASRATVADLIAKALADKASTASNVSGWLAVSRAIVYSAELSHVPQFETEFAAMVKAVHDKMKADTNFAKRFRDWIVDPKNAVAAQSSRVAVNELIQFVKTQLTNAEFDSTDLQKSHDALFRTMVETPPGSRLMSASLQTLTHNQPPNDFCNRTKWLELLGAVGRTV
ncbi:MAG: hypothetical protein JNK05_12330 [Myxococcales bacterium]|nr:hypothetical protein [Myxococcales bacterium]